MGASSAMRSMILGSQQRYFSSITDSGADKESKSNTEQVNVNVANYGKSENLQAKHS